METREVIPSSPAFFCGRPVQSSVKMTSELPPEYGNKASNNRSAMVVRGACATAIKECRTDHIPSTGNDGGADTSDCPDVLIPTHYPETEGYPKV